MMDGTPNVVAPIATTRFLATKNPRHISGALVSLLEAIPLTFVLGIFLLIPILTIVIVSFLDYDDTGLLFHFVLDNYSVMFGSSVLWRTYFHTVELAVIVWTLTLSIGFTVAYFLAFHIRATLWQMVLFQLCAVPFLTSNIIRMISWIPFLGRNGLINQALMGIGVSDHPLEFLLFSDFSIILAFVHLYTLFMVVPIFNTMMRIDRSLIEAARDAGANGLAVMTNVIVPLALPGIAIGTIFVVTLVMGDFVTVRMMGGGQSASMGLMMSNSISLLQYPTAAAQAVVLLLTVLLMVWAVLRVVDIRKEL